MKSVKVSAICALMMPVLFSTALVNPGEAPRTTQVQSAAGAGFAVLELFTSEGCSSCPPADELLAKIREEAGDKPVYILSYHVDYWDRLGWKDAFSDPAYTERQYAYSNRFAGQVYTPQLIINGKTEYVGSNESAITKAVADALERASSVSLKINARLQEEELQIDYDVSSNNGRGRLVIAVVQKNAVSKVKRGENEGRTLSHVQIVRKLFEFDLKRGNKRTEKISLPDGFNQQDWEIIGLVQNAGTGEIIAASHAIADK